MSCRQLLTAFAIRVALCFYAEYHDSNFEVRYTDIDYTIFTDGAKHVSEGGSPYDRDTYRYTPLVAYMMLPNINFHPMFGKILFCLADCLIGFLIYKMVSFDNVRRGTNATLAQAVWLFNTFTIAISSRGSFEPIQCCIVHLALWAALKRHYALCGLLWGFSVHVKMYTIIYGLSLYIWANIYTSTSGLKDMLMPNPGRIRLMLGALVGFGVPTGYFYYLYGYTFLHETFFYHLTREDTQHNFSPLFYPLRYLNEHPSDTSNQLKMAMSIGMTLLQMLLVIRMSFRYAAFHLPFAMFTQTCYFVVFNKVATSQYFSWYLCLLPLVIHRLPLRLFAWICIAVAWFGAQAQWLLQAYYFEFEKRDNLFNVFIASLIYLVSHTCIVMVLTSTFDSQAEKLQKSILSRQAKVEISERKRKKN